MKLKSNTMPFTMFSFCIFLRNHSDFNNWCYLSHFILHLTFKIPYLVMRINSVPPPPSFFSICCSVYLNAHAELWLISARHFIQLIFYHQLITRRGGKEQRGSAAGAPGGHKGHSEKNKKYQQRISSIFSFMLPIDNTHSIVKTFSVTPSQTGRSESQLLWLHWDHLHLSPAEIA